MVGGSLFVPRSAPVRDLRDILMIWLKPVQERPALVSRPLLLCHLSTRYFQDTTAIDSPYDCNDGDLFSRYVRSTSFYSQSVTVTSDQMPESIVDIDDLVPTIDQEQRGSCK